LRAISLIQRKPSLGA